MRAAKSRPQIAEPKRRALTPAETAERLRLSNRDLARLRHRGEGPAFVTLSRKTVRYLRSSVDEWEARHTAWNGDRTA
jgi:predicted DNA-binding transcriptional regulator AlpA